MAMGLQRIRDVLAYLSGGLCVGWIVFGLDVLSVREVLAAREAEPIFAFLLLTHLMWGLIMGGLALFISWSILGRADALLTRIASYFSSETPHRLARSVYILVGSTLWLSTLLVSWEVCIRCFAFNHVRLASALLLILLYAIHLGAWIMSSRISGLITGALKQRSLTADWLSPVVALMWPAGLLLGGATFALESHGTALQETWEALTLAPLVAPVCMFIGAYILEGSLQRYRSVYIVIITMSGVGLSWAGMERPATSMTGEDNSAVVQTRWGATTLHLLERFTDKDRDGFSALFGHGDCDDSNPDVWPGSTDGDDCSVQVKGISTAQLAAMMGSRIEPRNGLPVPSTGNAPTSGRPKEAQLLSTAVPDASVSDIPRVAELAMPQVPPELHSPSEPGVRKPMNLVLITIDTVRADHCGFQGYDRNTTPNLDAFAQQSAVFERAYAPSNMTPISIPAMLSGRYTSELFRDDGHFIRFDDNNRFLAEMLVEAGYQTRGVLTHWYFEKRKRSGLSQGFDHWTVVGTRWGKAMEDVSTSELVSAEAVRQIDALEDKRPWFLWVHFLDPHKWYIDHPGFERRWGRKSRDRYDHEIAFTDHHIGLVLNHLKKRADWDRTAVAVTSDHGEAFGEHKTHFHGFSMYEDQLRVPFIMRVPGLAPIRIKKRVGLIDLVPTLLELADRPVDPSLRGLSLLPEMQGESVPQRLIYAERTRGPHSSGLRALIDGDLKLVWRAAGNRYELYDLEDDPDEVNDLMGAAPKLATRLRGIQATFISSVLDAKGKVRRRR